MKRNSKLLLSRQTVRTLTSENLAGAVGGISIDWGSCRTMSARSNSAVESVFGCHSDTCPVQSSVVIPPIPGSTVTSTVSH